MSYILPTTPSCGSAADGKHVVFGRVVEGMATVKRMEVVGSRAGKTSRKVVIADSGQVQMKCGAHALD